MSGPAPGRPLRDARAQRNGRRATAAGRTSAQRAEPGDQRHGRRADRGSMTVLALAVVAVVLTVTVAGLVLVVAVVASHRARLAADLGALAGASALQRGDGVTAACARAAGVVIANRARVGSCSVDGANLTLSVDVAAPGWGSPAVARARAGPAITPSGPPAPDRAEPAGRSQRLSR